MYLDFQSRPNGEGETREERRKRPSGSKSQEILFLLHYWFYAAHKNGST